MRSPTPHRSAKVKLSARKQSCVRGTRTANGDGLWGLQIIGLIEPHRADKIGREAGLQRRIGVGQQCRGPVRVGDAEPAVGDFEIDSLGVVDLLVAVFLQALVAEIADQTSEPNIGAYDFRTAMPRDQCKRIERGRRIAYVGDFVPDSEEIAIIH